MTVGTRALLLGGVCWFHARSTSAQVVVLHAGARMTPFEVAKHRWHYAPDVHIVASHADGGRTIATRGNLGLELALGGAIDADNEVGYIDGCSHGVSGLCKKNVSIVLDHCTDITVGWYQSRLRPSFCLGSPKALREFKKSNESHHCKIADCATT